MPLPVFAETVSNGTSRSCASPSPSALDSADADQIKQHIDDCGPCLDEVALERLVKKLIARSCTERAPAELRQRVVFSIRQVQLQVSQVPTDPTEGTR